MNAEAQGIVFVVVWPFVLGLAIQVYVAACERLDARLGGK